MVKSILDLIGMQYESGPDSRFQIPEFKIYYVETNSFRKRIEDKWENWETLKIPNGMVRVRFEIDNNEIQIPKVDDPQMLSEIAKNFLEGNTSNGETEEKKLTLFLYEEKFSIILKWVKKDRYWLAITLRSDIKTPSVKNYPEIKVNLVNSRTNCLDHSVAFLVQYWFERKQPEINIHSENYSRFVHDSLRPFEEYLDAEKEIIQDNRFRLKCKYKKVESTEFIMDESADGDYGNFIKLKLIDPPRLFREPGTRVEVLEEGKGKKRYKNARSSEFWEDSDIILFDPKYTADWPEEGTLVLTGDMSSHRRKRNALKSLKKTNKIHLQRLLDAIVRPQALPPVRTTPMIPFNKKFDRGNQESKNQCEAIDLACSTPDFAIIQGPPGTGKTEVITEIVRQVIAKGGRVLLAAPTHVAVDNVLERIAGDKEIRPIRIGYSRKVEDKKLKEYLLSNCVSKWKSDIQEFAKKTLEQKKKPKESYFSAIQVEFFKDIQEESNVISQMIVDQANLICGTLLGIANFDFSRSTEEVPFEMLIIDEASKATLIDFLVPAVRARRWILVGDHRQLAPYVNDLELKIYLQHLIEEENKSENSNPDSFISNYEENYDDEYEKPSKGLNKAIEENYSREYSSTEYIKTQFHPTVEKIVRYLRRYHEETHRLDNKVLTIELLKEIALILKFQRKPIQILMELVDYALGSCFHYFFKRIDESRNVYLPVQHRMPPEIAEFLNKEVYSGKFRTALDAKSRGLKIKLDKKCFSRNAVMSPMEFISTSYLPDELKREREKRGGNKQGNFTNSGEADIISKILLCIIKNYPLNSFKELNSINFEKFSDDNPFTIGIITFYASQASFINKTLRELNKTKEIFKYAGKRTFIVKDHPIKVRTSIVDRFQGQEQEIVILSLTRSNNRSNIGFLKNLQRINVGISRAKQNLLICGDSEFFKTLNDNPGHELLRNLALLCYNKDWITYYVPGGSKMKEDKVGYHILEDSKIKDSRISENNRVRMFKELFNANNCNYDYFPQTKSFKVYDIDEIFKERISKFIRENKNILNCEYHYNITQKQFRIQLIT